MSTSLYKPTSSPTDLLNKLSLYEYCCTTKCNFNKAAVSYVYLLCCSNSNFPNISVKLGYSLIILHQNLHQSFLTHETGPHKHPTNRHVNSLFISRNPTIIFGRLRSRHTRLSLKNLICHSVCFKEFICSRCTLRSGLWTTEVWTHALSYRFINIIVQLGSVHEFCFHSYSSI